MMTIIRTTLPHGGKNKEIIKTWREQYPAKFERIFEQGDLLTRVASDEPDIAWGECIAAALARDVVLLPERWICIISSEGVLRCVLWDNNAVRRDEIVDSIDLPNWLKVYKANDIYLSHELDIGAYEPHIIGALELDSVGYELQEYLGSPLARLIKPLAMLCVLTAIVGWAMWPEPPPPPPPEVVDPWYTYRQQWENAMQAGEALHTLGLVCARYSTIPSNANMQAGTVEQGAINMAISDTAIDRAVLISWAKANKIDISFDGALPFLRVGVPVSSFWTNHQVNFNALDARLSDFFSGLSLVSNIKASLEPIQQNGVWLSRKATVNMQVSPWLMMEVGKYMKHMPIKLTTANISFDGSGNCTLSNAIIEFGGSSK